MDQSRIYLIALLLGLLVIPLAVFIARRRERKTRETWQTLEQSRRRRNMAEYRAWQWLYGKPRPRRLTDQRGGKGHSANPKP